MHKQTETHPTAPGLSSKGYIWQTLNLHQYLYKWTRTLAKSGAWRLQVVSPFLSPSMITHCHGAICLRKEYKMDPRVMTLVWIHLSIHAILVSRSGIGDHHQICTNVFMNGMKLRSSNYLPHIHLQSKQYCHTSFGINYTINLYRMSFSSLNYKVGMIRHCINESWISNYNKKY